MVNNTQKMIKALAPKADVASFGSEPLIIPNHSGRHDAGRTGTPTEDLQIANKKYVDDSISSIPTPTLQQVTDAGATTDNNISIDGKISIGTADTTYEAQLYSTSVGTTFMIQSGNAYAGVLRLKNTEGEFALATNDGFIGIYDYSDSEYKFKVDDNGDTLINGNLGVGAEFYDRDLTPQFPLEFIGPGAGAGISWVGGFKQQTNSVTPGYGTGIKLLNGYYNEYTKWGGIASIAESSYANYTGLGFYSNETENMRLTYDARLLLGLTSSSLASGMHIKASDFGHLVLDRTPSGNAIWTLSPSTGIKDGTQKAFRLAYQLNDAATRTFPFAVRQDGTIEGIGDLDISGDAIIDTNAYIGGDTGIGVFETEGREPNKPLHVSTTDNGAKQVLQTYNSTTNYYTGMLMKVSGNAQDLYQKAGILFERTGGNGIGKLHLVNNGIADSSNADLSDAKLTIDSNANIGINNISPQYKLHIDGDSSSSNFMKFGVDSGYTNGILSRGTTTSSNYRNFRIVANDIELNTSTSDGGTASANRVTIKHTTGDVDITSNLTVGGTLNIPTHTPSSASDTGTAGDICWDGSYIYICTATDTWKRVAISTW